MLELDYLRNVLLNVFYQFLPSNCKIIYLAFILIGFVVIFVIEAEQCELISMLKDLVRFMILVSQSLSFSFPVAFTRVEYA